jgi:hypothetical protein
LKKNFLKSDITNSLRNRGAEFFPPSLIFKVVRIMMRQNYLKALEFSSELSKLYSKSLWTHFIPIAKLFLTPSIYEG